ncbi:hypothetical protein ETI01_08105 [Macrococcoides caseolyticum]|uniref:hypothetical protein n=1 Tax=Macrococcoides caseolyticum TaxID=69966 RepID=UPI001060E6B1|nr:hypothetical protein [Macrococcus caseolyticus]TDM23357.1 hypothetical protein ETI01_08105 [Macrococcus caseolyticus]
MDRKQVAEILKLVKQLYPKFNINQTVADAWWYVLQNADYELTKAKLYEHYGTSKFEPKVSEIKMIKGINHALLQYEEIQKEIEINRNTPIDPEKQKLIEANLKRLEGADDD